jgi:hypothetical protein
MKGCKTDWFGEGHRMATTRLRRRTGRCSLGLRDLSAPRSYARLTFQGKSSASCWPCTKRCWTAARRHRYGLHTTRSGYSKTLEYEYRVKTAALDTLKRYSIISLTLYLE